MGAMQTWNLTLFYPKLLGYSLPMSGGHTDPYWNEVFRKYAPLLFKQ